MRKAIIIAAALSMLSVAAQARDVTLKMNEQQAQALLSLLDLAAKEGGARAAPAVAMFMNMLQQASKPEPKPGEKPEEKKTDESKDAPEKKIGH